MSFISTSLLLVCLAQGANGSLKLLQWTKGLPGGSIPVGIIGVAFGIAFVTYEDAYDVSTAAILGIIALIINLVGCIIALRISEEYESI